MTRLWLDLVAAVGDAISLPLAVLLLVVTAAIVAVLWFFFPAWVPRHLPNWRAWRPRRPRKRARKRQDKRGEPIADTSDEPTEVADDELPAVPAATLHSLADRLHAQGRYAEAIRERLRAMVRDLVDNNAIEHRPGWTVIELAAAASTARPAVGPPLDQAAWLFSEIWYGMRPAYSEHDDRMRALAAAVGEALGPATATGVLP